MKTGSGSAETKMSDKLELEEFIEMDDLEGLTQLHLIHRGFTNEAKGNGGKSILVRSSGEGSVRSSGEGSVGKRTVLSNSWT